MNSSKESLAILGRGIAGLTSAYYLTKADFVPTIFGRKEGSAQASRAAQGVLCNKGLIFSNSPLFRAKLESLEAMKAFLDELEALSGLAIPRYFKGVSEPFWSEEDFRATVTRIYRHKFWGAHRTIVEDAAHWPSEARQRPLGSLHYPADGWFDPRAVLDALESYLEAQGVSFIEEEAKALKNAGGRVAVDGALFDRVLIANGAGFFDLWPQLSPRDLRMFLIGGQTLECPRPAKEETRILVKGNQSIALLDSKAIIGSSSWLGTRSADIATDALKLLEECEANFGLRFEEGLSRSGTRLRFKDRMPLVGWLNHGDFEGKVYLMTGFYKNGMHLAEICAREAVHDFKGETEKRRYPDFSGRRLSL